MPWRPMRVADLPKVEAIADLAHPGHPEHPAVFAERLALAPEGAWVLGAAEGTELLGYAIGHPWTGHAPPGLDTLLGGLPRPAPAWHVHDIALLPAARGGGRARVVLRRMLARARHAGCGSATLVALAGKAEYWRRLGFVPVPSRDAPAVASYGAGALFMRRMLRPPAVPRPHVTRLARQPSPYDAKSSRT